MAESDSRFIQKDLNSSVVHKDMSRTGYIQKDLPLPPIMRIGPTTSNSTNEAMLVKKGLVAGFRGNGKRVEVHGREGQNPQFHYLAENGSFNWHVEIHRDHFLVTEVYGKNADLDWLIEHIKTFDDLRRIYDDWHHFNPNAMGILSDADLHHLFDQITLQGKRIIRTK